MRSSGGSPRAWSQSRGPTGAFASAVLARGKTYTFRFDVAGTYRYRDALNPSVTGTVKVAGPHDGSDAFTSWVRRAARGGPRRPAGSPRAAVAVAQTSADVVAWYREPGEPVIDGGFSDTQEARVLASA